MRGFGTIFLLLIVVLWSSCSSDFDTTPSTGNLEFSRDTVYLDTVFSNTGSGTYSLKVYNRTNDDLTIPKIQLSLGEGSGYRLNVDGIPGKSFEDIELLAKDSIYIFIETTVDFSDLTTQENQFLYTDAIEFHSESYLQKVPLVTLIKDAVFLYPQRNPDGSTETISFGTGPLGEETQINGFYLSEEHLQFTKEKPYVIYGFAAVPEGKTLEIEAGARIHFHAESGIIVPSGASIQANGQFSEDRELLENEIIFEGDRLEPQFSDIPGQWGAIWLMEGSTENSFTHTSIRNSTIGLLIDGNASTDSSPLRLSDTQIYNSSSFGIFARNANITGENLVINNSGQTSLHLELGGTYNFRHSTFANYWQNSFRNHPAVYISNGGANENGISYQDLEEASFSNCIIFGSRNQELSLIQYDEAAFSYKFDHCLIRSAGAAESLTDPAHFENILLNSDPQFLDPQKNNLQLTESSPARNFGSETAALEVPQDILHTDRTTQPDLGAYEWVSQEDETEEEN